jgi:hypothetical protein
MNPSGSFDNLPGEYEHLDPGARAKAAAYGYRLHANLCDLIGQGEFAAHTPQVRHMALLLASGHSAPEPVTDPDDPAWVAPAVAATVRAEANMKAWFGDKEIGESTMQDALTDLFHYAQSNGMKPTEIGEIIHRAQFIQRDELENPEG